MASDGDGVYEYALKAGNDAGGSEEGLVTVAELFRIHCTRSLCAESWEFILACIVYKASGPPLHVSSTYFGPRLTPSARLQGHTRARTRSDNVLSEPFRDAHLYPMTILETNSEWRGQIFSSRRAYLTTGCLIHFYVYEERIMPRQRGGSNLELRQWPARKRIFPADCSQRPVAYTVLEDRTLCVDMKRWL